MPSISGPDNAYVYVVAPDNTVSSKTVTILNDDGVNDAIEGDVHPGDRVVVEGQLRIVPGTKVQVRNTAGRRPRPQLRHAVMNISKIFIERPVFTTLLMAALVIFGLFGYSTLPVSRIAAGGLPHHLRLGRPAGRRPFDHGLVGGDAAGKPVLQHPGRQLDDVAKLAGPDRNRHPVRSGP